MPKDPEGDGWRNNQIVLKILGPNTDSCYDRDPDQPVLTSHEKAVNAELDFIVKKNLKRIMVVPKLNEMTSLSSLPDSTHDALRPYLGSVIGNYPIFVLQAAISDSQKSLDKAPPVTSEKWKERMTFVASRALLKFFPLKYLTDLLRNHPNKLNKLSKASTELIEKSFQKFDDYTVFSIKPYSICPKRLYMVKFKKTEWKNTWKLVEGIDINYVVGETDHYAKYALSSLIHHGFNMRCTLGAGSRSNSQFESNEPIEYCDTYIDCHEQQFEVALLANTNSVKCVPCAFGNLMSILGCEDYFEAFRTMAGSMSVHSENIFEECFALLDHADFEKKPLYSSDASSCVATVMNYSRLCNMPMIVSLIGYAGSRPHCIVIFRGQIIDCLDSKSYPLTIANLVYSVGSSLRSIKEGFILKPNKGIGKKYYKTLENDDLFRFDYPKYECLPAGKCRRNRRSTKNRAKRKKWVKKFSYLTNKSQN